MAVRTALTAFLLRVLYPLFLTRLTSFCRARLRADLWFANPFLLVKDETATFPVNGSEPES